MIRRDVALLAFRTVALWFAIYGIGAMAIAFASWRQDGPGVGVAHLGYAVLLVLLAGTAWASAPWLASRLFPASDGQATGISRADLWSTIVLGIGLFLLARALPRLAYWLVVWWSATGTEFWSKVTGWRTDDTVVYTVAFRAQLAETLTQLVIGIACVFGLDRILRVLARLRAQAHGSKPRGDVDRPAAGRD